MSIQTAVRNRVIAFSAVAMIATPVLAQTQTIPQGPLMQAPVEQAATQPTPPVSPAAPTPAQIARDYVLGAGDIVRINVFQNPDLTTETRVSEAGAITFPLVGNVQVGGLSLADAEKKIATLLRDGNYVKQPQVTMLVTQNQGNQVAVLGQVEQAGPLSAGNHRRALDGHDRHGRRRGAQRRRHRGHHRCAQRQAVLATDRRGQHVPQRAHR
ncbi:MAG: polysaccharide biosynthesis/export family protein [Rhodocyclaceae bacterium]